MTNCNEIISICESEIQNKIVATKCQGPLNEKSIHGMVKDCKDTNLNNDDTNSKMQPKSCDELWNKCQILCSTINPLERIKYTQDGCCVTSPIPTGADYFKPIEQSFSKKTTFSYYRDMVEVDQNCTCVKFNGIDEMCRHPLCQNNSKCLSQPSPLCLPAQSWKKYFGQID